MTAGQGCAENAQGAGVGIDSHQESRLPGGEVVVQLQLLQGGRPVARAETTGSDLDECQVSGATGMHREVALRGEVDLGVCGGAVIAGGGS